VAMTADVKTRGLRAGIGLVITAVLLGALLWWHPPGLYLWAKAFHIIAVISWMAGMLYLPRLFIYHCEAEPGSRQSETFKVMERRLLTIIINPAMVVTWVLGLWLAHDGGWLKAEWLHAKFALVVVLSAFMASWCAGCVTSAPTRTGILRNSIVLSMKYRQLS